LLAAQPQYVIPTSEFQDITRQIDSPGVCTKGYDWKVSPTLRRPAGNTRTQGDDSQGAKPNQDELPTLKRRNL
jgi:hypothetical protein